MNFRFDQLIKIAVQVLQTDGTAVAPAAAPTYRIYQPNGLAAAPTQRSTGPMTQLGALVGVYYIEIQLPGYGGGAWSNNYEGAWIMQVYATVAGKVYPTVIQFAVTRWSWDSLYDTTTAGAETANSPVDRIHDLSNDGVKLNAQGKLDVNAECDTAIADARLDELVAAGAAAPVAGSFWDQWQGCRLNELLSVASAAGSPIATSLIDLILNTDGTQGFIQATDSLQSLRANQQALAVWLASLRLNELVSAGAAAPVAGSFWDQLISWRLDQIVENARANPAIGSFMEVILNEASGVHTYAQGTDSLEALRNRMDAINTAMPNTIWDELTAGHIVAGSYGVAVTDIMGAGFLTATDSLEALRDRMDAINTAMPNTIWDELTAGHIVAGSFAVAVTDILADTNEMQSLGVFLNAVGVAQVNTECDTAIETYRLHELLNLANTGNPTQDSFFDLVMNQVGGGFGFNRATDSLEAIGAGVGGVPGAVWDELVAAHNIVNTFGWMIQEIRREEEEDDFTMEGR